MNIRVYQLDKGNHVLLVLLDSNWIYYSTMGPAEIFSILSRYLTETVVTFASMTGSRNNQG